MTRFEPFDRDKIKTNLKTARIGREVMVFSSTSSTNDIAWQCEQNVNNDGLVIFTEEQTTGRGRAGAKWLSGKFESILCSILLLDCHISAELLTLTGAVATAEAIGRCGGSQAKIKWPNDVLVNDKKVAGILVESKRSGPRLDFAIGIGINCHQKINSFSTELRHTATSLDIESRTITDRVSLAKRLLVGLDDWLIATAENSEKVIDKWRHLSTQLGHRVTLSYNNQLFSGNCTGVDPQKGLVMHLDNGSVRMFDAAHTNIVKPQ